MILKIILSPYSYSVFSIGQFIIWFLIFDSWKYYVPGLSRVNFYFTVNSLILYISLLLVYTSSVWLGTMVVNSWNFTHKYYRLGDTNYKNELSGVFTIGFTFGVLILLVLELASFRLTINIFKGITPRDFLTRSMAVEIAYATLQNENNLWRTGYNVLPFVFAVFGYIQCTKVSKMYYKILFAISAVISIRLFLTAARQLAFVSWTAYLLTVIKMKGMLDKKKQKKISTAFFFVMLLIIILVIPLAELLRFGILNSKRKEILLFSVENIFDTIKYLLVAYVAKNVNNCMIFLDSTPSYSMFYAGSQFFENLIISSLGANRPNFIQDIGPHGTSDFLGLLWLGWGKATFAVLCFIGFFSGILYKFWLENDSYDVVLTYSIIFPGFFSNLRINYFFLNLFIYPFLLIAVLRLVENIRRK